MNILKPTDANITAAAEIIKNGGIAAFPTETVYGLGADALNPIAVAKIFEAKKRPFFDPLIVHIAELSDMDKITKRPDSKSLKLMERFWPGPLTIILEKNDNLPHIVTSSLPNVAVRMPSNNIALEFIKKSGTTIAAPSANRFGCLSPTSAEHVYSQLGSSVDIIIDGGQCTFGIESTIIKILEDKIYLLRHGAITKEEIEEFIKEPVVLDITSDKTEAPGQLPYHYSPEKQIILIDKITTIEERCGYLFYKKPDFYAPENSSKILSEKGNLREAAANLFSHLHYLDRLDIDIIYAEKIEEKGLGIAIMDRLNKASRKNNK
ncbi:MAG: L-threonylcarbamoyladenylate synthase [Spirochaetes bacterium]|nr:L-threonylcarbamoyladenylate synthase [Spirochaetota bacterium]